MTIELDGLYLIKNLDTGGYIKSIERGQINFTINYFMAKKWGTQELAESTMNHLTSFGWSGLRLMVCKATIQIEEVR